MTDQSIPKPYRAAVFDGAWGLVAVSEIAATHSSEAGTAWSERHQLEIVAPEDGNYHVAFYPSNPSTDMSLAIANVQLQEISDDLAGLTPYIQTDGKRQVSNEACAALDKNELLTAFTRRCEGGRGDELGRAPACFYELNKHIVIDAESHNLGFGALGGQISVGNSNLRHVDLAVNLVGTGILDCSESANASCYGSAFVEYDLEHLAYNAAIQNQRDQTSCFNFGTGRILGGKAMAAERFLTLPLASTDRELLAEAAFTKTELFGRPLSGVYTLRLRDNPALVFDRLEDIQILMRYRYWSRVDRTAN